MGWWLSVKRFIVRVLFLHEAAEIAQSAWALFPVGVGAAVSVIAYLKEMDGLTLFVYGLVAFAFTLWVFAVLRNLYVERGKNQAESSEPSVSDDVVVEPEPECVPLPVAARLVYEATLGTTWALAAERIGMRIAISNQTSREEAILNLYAAHISDEGATPVFGTRPPSEKLELVPMNELHKSCDFRGGGAELRYKGDRKLAYTNLCVERSALDARIEEMTEGGDVTG